MQRKFLSLLHCPKKMECKTCMCTLKERIEKCFNYKPLTTDEDFLLRVFQNRIKNENNPNNKHEQKKT